MSLFAHLVTLEEKHAKLEAEIEAESQRPLPDFSLITQMKKQKLHLKEQMAQMGRYREAAKHANAS